jgi:hypothetical protein
MEHPDCPPFPGVEERHVRTDRRWPDRSLDVGRKLVIDRANGAV